MMYGFHWLTFSETRLGKIGPCGRRWMLSCSLGLDECFREAIQENTTSRYYASGYLSADFEVRRWLVIAGFAALPVESMVLELLEDDRFFLRAAELKRDMDMETEYVGQMDECFFEEVARVCELPMSASQIKHEVLLSLHISRGYVHAESYYALTQDPWCLTQGDIEANTNGLLSRDVAPKDPATKKMWVALKCDVLQPTVHTRCMHLLQDQPGTNLLSEKNHGVHASSKKKHQVLSSDRLLARSFGVVTTTLVQTSKEDYRIQQMEEKVENLEKKKTSRLNGKNMLCSEMMQSQALEKGDRCKREALSDNRNSVAEHHKKWKDLDAVEKNQYAIKAQEERDRRDVMREMELDEARTHLDFAKRRRLAQMEQQRSPNTMSCLRLTPDALESVADQFYSPEICRGEELKEEWQRLVEPPKEPSAAVKEAILAAERESSVEEADPPPLWQRLMCQHRNLFAETVIVFGDAPDIGYYFLFGKQTSQRTCAFLQGERMRVVLPAFEVLAPGDVGDFELGVRFDCSAAVYKAGKEIRNAGDVEIFLYHHAKLGDGTFTCRHEPVKFEDFCLLLPLMDLEPPRTEGGGGGRAVSRDWFAKLQEEFPWLTMDDFPVAGAVGGVSRAGRHAHAAEPRRALGAELGESEAVEIRRRLTLKRKLWARDVPDVFFYIAIRGGVWTQEFKGVEADCASVFARAPARPWCERYGMPKSKSFAFTRFTEEGAMMLCHEWHRKLHFFSSSGERRVKTTHTATQMRLLRVTVSLTISLFGAPASTLVVIHFGPFMNS